MNMNAIWPILLFFEIKHCLSDYVLQTRTMVFGKRLPGKDFIIPLATHAGVHAIFTLIFLVIYKPSMSYLAIFDFVSHFIIDRTKEIFTDRSETPNIKKNVLIYGLDQLFHRLVYYFILFKLVS